MQNYRLKLLSERLELDKKIKPIAIAAHDQAKKEVEAARRHLKLRTDLERQMNDTDDERKRAGCTKLLEQSPPLETLKDNLRLTQRKLSSTIRLLWQIQETEARHQDEMALTIAVEAYYSEALDALREKFGDDIEVVYKLDEKKRVLHIFFGGQDFPLGPGHAHWVYRRTRYVFRRDPEVVQVAC